MIQKIPNKKDDVFNFWFVKFLIKKCEKLKKLTFVLNVENDKKNWWLLHLMLKIVEKMAIKKIFNLKKNVNWSIVFSITYSSKIFSRKGKVCKFFSLVILHVL